MLAAMKLTPILLALALSVPASILAGSCSRVSNAANPPCAGFDDKGSDAKAMAVADEVMAAMGGRAAWDGTRCIGWNFFGKRNQLWDKKTGDYRLEEKNRVTLMNVSTGEGRVFEDGKEITDAGKKDEALKHAKSVWINDSYWLLMPYKLKDTGLTLKYKGEDKLPDGRAADVLLLTFKNIGDTPDNKYEVYVSKDKHLVEQWSYYTKCDDPKPAIQTAWTDWKPYGKILIASGRGDKGAMTDIAVYDTPPEKLKTP